MSFIWISPAVKAHVRYARHVLLEEIRFDNIDHLLQLAEDEYAVLREDSCGSIFRLKELAFTRRIYARSRSCTDATVEKDLSER